MPHCFIFMKHLNIPSSSNLPFINGLDSPPKQTLAFTKYLNTPKMQPQPNILLTTINKNDFIQFLVKVSEDLISCYANKTNSNFVFELFSRCKASLSLVQATLILYIRCKQNPISPFHFLQEEKLFMGCIMVAHLFLMDSTYNMKSWRIITGLDNQLLKMIRHITLETLDHRLWIHREVYFKFNMKLLELYKLKNWNINELPKSIEEDLFRFKEILSRKFKSESNLRELLMGNTEYTYSMEICDPDESLEPAKKRKKFMEMPNL